MGYLFVAAVFFIAFSITNDGEQALGAIGFAGIGWAFSSIYLSMNYEITKKTK